MAAGLSFTSHNAGPAVVVVFYLEPIQTFPFMASHRALGFTMKTHSLHH